MSPFKTLAENDSVLMISSKGLNQGMIMYESRVRFLVKEPYVSHRHAWELFSKKIPKKYLKNLNGTPMKAEDFLSNPYTRAAAKSGYLLGFVDEPVRWIGKPRTPKISLSRHGWGKTTKAAVPEIVKSENPESSRKSEMDGHENAIRHRKDLGVRQKETLILARVGQGKFRTNLKLVEAGCRITGTTDSNYLIASHIKPWSESNDLEKLDGNNGLLLSPQFDYLFDRGFITFETGGNLLVSRAVPSSVVKNWKIPYGKNFGTFNPRQRTYLKYHQQNIFERRI